MDSESSCHAIHSVIWYLWAKRKNFKEILVLFVNAFRDSGNIEQNIRNVQKSVCLKFGSNKTKIPTLF